ncbi:MAG: MarR family winged helix-turn-helix transcriptional regulator [Cyclobacteriaceae bacterium]
MRIEDEIKQSVFRNEYAKLLINLLFTGNWIHHYNKKFLKKYQLSPEQYNVLRILRGQHPSPASINMLNDRMLDKMSNVSRLVEKLRIKELIIRQESEIDRRQVDIFITDKGLELLAEVDQEIPKVEMQFHNLSEKEASQLNNLLDKLRG